MTQLQSNVSILFDWGLMSKTMNVTLVLFTSITTISITLTIDAFVQTHTTWWRTKRDAWKSMIKYKIESQSIRLSQFTFIFVNWEKEKVIDKTRKHECICLLFGDNAEKINVLSLPNHQNDETLMSRLFRIGENVTWLVS